MISREQALTNEVFASFISKWQKRYDPSEDPYMTEAGNYYDYEIDKERYFDQDEIDEINKRELDEFYKRKDNVQIKDFEYFGELIYNLNYTDIIIYSIEIGNIIEQLSKALNEEIIFILDYTIPWLSQENEYEPVAKALNYLKHIGTSNDFCGAYKLTGKALAEFVAHLFWIIRCNASLPYCWFSTDKHAFVGEICQYGNIHLHAYSNEIKHFFETFATNNSLIKIEACIEAFSSDGGIEGRQIIVS